LTGTAGVSAPPVYQLATFTDTDLSKTAADYTVGLDWGDHQQGTGTVLGSNGNFTIDGSHAYAGAGAFTVTGSILSQGVLAATTTSSVNPALPALMLAVAPPLAQPQLLPPELNVKAQKITYASPAAGLVITSDDGKTRYATPTWQASKEAAGAAREVPF